MSMYSDSGSSSIRSKLAFGAGRPLVRITFNGVEVRDEDRVPFNRWTLPHKGGDDMFKDVGDRRPGAVITVAPEPHVDEGDDGYSGCRQQAPAHRSASSSSSSSGWRLRRSGQTLWWGRNSEEGRILWFVTVWVLGCAQHFAVNAPNLIVFFFACATRTKILN